jgi:methylated-DNA-[protein]-cysteine S-methyltransferase
MSETLYRAIVDSPVGPLTLLASDAGLRAVLWDVDDEARVRVSARIVDRPDHEVLAAAARQLDEYFAGDRRQFDLPLDPVGTTFQRQAWAVLCAIPFGERISYGEQARRLGDPRKARAAGAANGRNPISIVVPCHRVVGADGSLTGFAAGTDRKAWLLDHEAEVCRRS